MTRASRLLLWGALAAVPACGDTRPSLPEGSLVLTQVPPSPPGPAASPDALDVRYPAGSRVVLAVPPDHPDHPGAVRPLSSGLEAAGNPVVSWDGRRVVFAGKAAPAGRWQVYEADLGGGRPRALTEEPGGAMDPALLPDGALVFASPVPRSADTWSASPPPALHTRPSGGGPAHRITFGPGGEADPTVLGDGRVLFVAPTPSSPRLALFTVNHDGTAVMAYAGQHEGGPALRRPREISGGRVAFLASARGPGPLEAVLAARPFSSRARLAPVLSEDARSVEPAGGSGLLVAIPSGGSTAVFRFGPEGARGLLFDDPAFDDVEAAPLAARARPMGHLSTVDPSRSTGLLLCLDVNDTTVPGSAAATRVRFLAGGERGDVRTLGEVPLASDGSFLAEVPADVALGFEALDVEGRTLRRLSPTVWVRPGEIRGCMGCHEPHGRCPRNRRPLAVKSPPARVGEPVGLTSKAGPRQ